MSRAFPLPHPEHRNAAPAPSSAPLGRGIVSGIILAVPGRPGASKCVDADTISRSATTKWVADRYEFRDRFQNLSWTHQLQAAPWPFSQRSEALCLAESAGWAVGHARYAVFQLAEAALPRSVFAGVLDRISRLRDPPTDGAPA